MEKREQPRYRSVVEAAKFVGRVLVDHVPEHLPAGYVASHGQHEFAANHQPTVELVTEE